MTLFRTDRLRAEIFIIEDDGRYWCNCWNLKRDRRSKWNNRAWDHQYPRISSLEAHLLYPSMKIGKT